MNGDVDNYQELLEVYRERDGATVDERITTDAKIIPVAVNYHYAKTGDLVEAFRRAFAEFEGSMAIGVMAADRPGEFVFGQKGSGQGLFFGAAPESMAVASEMYGLVEVTPRYVKAEGEQVEGGEVFHLDARESGRVALRLATSSSQTEVGDDRYRRAEITTRDINRGEFSHFLTKEIAESVDSVRKTLRGKFEERDGVVRSLLGEDVLTPECLAALKSGAVRRVFVIGQGTAAVAGQGVAHLLRSALRGAALQVIDMKATELSGHYMEPDMSDALVVAISQSGTTTDTNRTVDMVRDRGAWVIGIVNRRNSDLVYKSHGVLYTSDGRDIEMSVASTKAFYAQNVAGQVLALSLALELRTRTNAEIRAELDALNELPGAMTGTLALDGEVAAIASELAPKRRYWALVGSGATKIAADEVRIKLSELCYKSIASDFLEDKKHIDLSSEPLILVCANGIPEATVSDVVKEVAIFKAHASIPIVVTEEGEDRFDPYAAAIVKVPRYSGRLSYLLSTMIGHLFGYHAAAAFDRRADTLRRLRAAIITSAERSQSAGVDLTPNAVISSLSSEVTAEVVELDHALTVGDIDSGIDAGVATRLAETIAFLQDRLPADSLARRHDSFVDALLDHLSESINQLARPIDAIKHQAKTVTVGISRSEEGSLWRSVRELGFESSQFAESHRRFLSTFGNLVEVVEGVTVYQVDGLDPAGRPSDETRVSVADKRGCAASIASRCESAQTLSGTKWGVVRHRELYVGFGQNDARKIVIVPVQEADATTHLVLFHLDLVQNGDHATRVAALESLEERFEQVRIAVTERDLPWDTALLQQVDNETLFFAEPQAVAEAMLTGSTV